MTDAERHALVVNNLAFARWMAVCHHRRSHLARRLGLEDLEAVAAMAMVQAARAYDPGRGVRFISYAGPRITWAIYDAVRHVGVVSVTSNLVSHPLQGEVTCRLAASAWRARSLEAMAADGATELECLVDPEAADPCHDKPGPGARAAVLLREILPRLPERERRALLLWRIDGLSLRDVGRELGVSRSRACQVCTAALRRARRVALALEEE